MNNVEKEVVMVKQHDGKHNGDAMIIDIAPPPLSIEAVRERLRPAADTPAALQDSIELAKQLRTELQTGAQEAKREWMLQQITGTSAAIAEAERAMVQQNKVLEFVEDYEGALSLSLAKREELDRAAKIDKAAAEAEDANVAAEEAAISFKEKWHSDYARAAAVIVRLLEEEREAIALFNVAQTKTKEALKMGVTHVRQVEHPTTFALGKLSYGWKPIGDVVQLPGVLGAPFIPLNTIEVTKTVDVPYLDWEAPEHDFVYPAYEAGVLRYARQPQKIRQETVKSLEYVVEREDKPFWVWLQSPLNGKVSLKKLF